MLRPFETYSAIEKDEIRKQGLRVISYAYKYGKQCSVCGWDNANHLWLSSLPRPELSGKLEPTVERSKWVPLDRVPQSKLIAELERRTIICAVCRRMHPAFRPPYQWQSCIKRAPCVECGLIGLKGWKRVETQYGLKKNKKRGAPIQVTIESQRCGRCKCKFDKRVQRAKELNRNRKKAVGACQACQISVEKLGSAAFDWDHLDREAKSGNIGSMTMAGAPIPDIRKEIDKCRLLCVRCHLDHTLKQLKYSDPIGKIKSALKKAESRTFNEKPLDLCDSSDELD